MVLALSGIGSSSILLNQTQVQAQGGKLDWPSQVLHHQTPGAVEPPVVTQLAVHPAGNRAAIVGDDHIVRLVNLDSGRREKTLQGHSDWIRAAEFTPDGTKLITAGVDHKIISWNPETGEGDSFAVAPSSIEGISISPDGTLLAVVGFDAQLRLYRLHDQKLVASFTCPCSDMRCVQFSPSGNTLVAGGRSGKLRIWSRDGAKWLAGSRDIPAHRQRIRSVDFLDETTIVSCSEDRTIQKTDVATMAATKLAETDGRKFDIAVIEGRSIACCGSTNQIELFDIRSGQSLGHLEGHKGTVSCIEYHDGKLISGSYDTEARVWKMTQEVSLPASQPDHTASLELPAIQPSGTLSPPPTLK